MRGFLLVLGMLLVFAPAAGAQPRAAPDGIAALLTRTEALLASGGSPDVSSILSPSADAEVLRAFFHDLAPPGVSRAVVRERDRGPLEGVLPGDGFSVIVDFFTATARRGRIVTARVDVRRPSRSERDDEWGILAAERLTGVDGLHRLSVNPDRQFAARDLTITAPDLQLVLEEGQVFVVDSEDGVTGLVLLGRGEMHFAPEPEAERGQVRIFSGSDALTARFDTAFLRMNPAEYEARVSVANLTSVPVNARLLRRAQTVFAEDAPKSFSLHLADLSRDTWYLVPGVGDFLAEVRTRRHGTLTYARASTEPEDITLFERARQRNIALYASPQKLSARGRFYNEDDLADYDVLHYDVEAAITPDRQLVEGRTRMRIRVRAFALASLTIRLADPLVVSAVVSTEFGRLLHLRVMNQNSIVINLPRPMARDDELTLTIAYAGRVPPAATDREALQFVAQSRDDLLSIPREPYYLLSNRAFWYPQAQVTDYATASLRISVPEGFGCVASGEPAPGAPEALRREEAPSREWRRYTFTALDPLRYLAVVVSRLSTVADIVVPLVEGAETGPVTAPVTSDGRRAPGFRVRDRVALTVHANPRQQGRARELAAAAGDVLRFYAALMGEAPYPAMTLAFVEHELPGGHSPAYMAVLNNPPPITPFFWRNDPASFSGFPAFFVAHEIAHQWWGQAVGWKNYREQWISEGFAQYFAALYAEKAHGEGAFTEMLRQFRRWALAESHQGPVSLGYRIGHIKGEQRVFRALLYNKGAAVLHMLRRLVGDEAFFSGLRRFYSEKKFEKAGTDDLQRAFEAETGIGLERFFERWIHGSELPRLRYASTIAPGAVTVRFTQRKDLVFDLPVTVTIVYADGRTTDVVVPITAPEAVREITTEGAVRSVHVNRDAAALAHFDES